MLDETRTAGLPLLSLPGTPAETCNAGLSSPALRGRWPKPATPDVRRLPLRGRWLKPAPPDFLRPLSGDAGRNLHRRTFAACPYGDAG